MDLNPGGILSWLAVGLIAGWLAGRVMKGSGYGTFGNVVLGMIGAFIGGLIFSFLLPGTTAGFWGSIGVAFIGAVALILVLRAIPGRQPFER